MEVPSVIVHSEDLSKEHDVESNACWCAPVIYFLNDAGEWYIATKEKSE